MKIKFICQECKKDFMNNGMYWIVDKFVMDEYGRKIKERIEVCYYCFGKFYMQYEKPELNTIKNNDLTFNGDNDLINGINKR